MEILLSYLINLYPNTPWGVPFGTPCGKPRPMPWATPKLEHGDKRGTVDSLLEASTREGQQPLNIVTATFLDQYVYILSEGEKPKRSGASR